jgi:hypothetical protein
MTRTHRAKIMMTQFEPPQPPGMPPTEPAAASAPYVEPPLSKAAVSGLVCSLIICIPVVPLVGLILGIIGIPATAAGKRRGRGLAIGAIIVAVVTTGLQGLLSAGVVVTLMRYLSFQKEIAPPIRAALKASTPRVPEAAQEAYQVMSPRFQVKVSQEQFEQWLRTVIAKHGQLQEIQQPEDPREFMVQEPYGLTFNLTGRFVNGEATITIRCGFSSNWSGQLEADDILVDGVSPRPPEAIELPKEIPD